MKIELIQKVADTLKISQTKANTIVVNIIETLKQGIAQEGKVTIRGFGSFYARNKTKRIGRNPKTGKSAIISARRVPSFKASKLLKNKLN